ncbi:MAG: hypothetical protein K0R44_3648, partial [Thermomicrobiales bacterium]|nr:hypothetical protein [Thermomicrobiales bacterium]
MRKRVIHMYGSSAEVDALAPSSFVSRDGVAWC